MSWHKETTPVKLITLDDSCCFDLSWTLQAFSSALQLLPITAPRHHRAYRPFLNAFLMAMFRSMEKRRWRNQSCAIPTDSKLDLAWIFSFWSSTFLWIIHVWIQYDQFYEFLPWWSHVAGMVSFIGSIQKQSTLLLEVLLLSCKQRTLIAKMCLHSRSFNSDSMKWSSFLSTSRMPESGARCHVQVWSLRGLLVINRSICEMPKGSNFCQRWSATRLHPAKNVHLRISKQHASAGSVKC